MGKKFESVAATLSNSKWNQMIKRQNDIYRKENDLRSEFERDYTRVIHSNSYRRLKHKTQVFYSPTSDHICTRIEHVNLVESISYTISETLGLNSELTKAIAVAHDIGHSPFGHEGERIISAIQEKELKSKFWHEKNGLRMVDDIELLENADGKKENLNLTYAVRDGIISHCGEIDENSIRPRDEAIDLNDYTYPNEYNPYTWEACVVKIADKISYIGRDIEDALNLKVINQNDLNELYKMINLKCGEKITNTKIINDLICDLCDNSSIENGLCFSKKMLNLMDTIKDFNCKYIYRSKRIEPSIRYFNVVINEIFNILKDQYDSESFEKTYNNLKILEEIYPIVNEFVSWIVDHSIQYNNENMGNKKIYDLLKRDDYIQSILDFISGMTDKYAVQVYDEIISF